MIKPLIHDLARPLSTPLAARVTLGAVLACLAAGPASPQVLTPMPFGQSVQLITPMPFGQRNRSPLRSLSTASTLALAAQWNMDNTFGTTMEDSSGNGNNGTTYDVVTSGNGYVFNGTSSKVIVPDSPTLNPGDHDFTFTAQVQISVPPAKGATYEVLRKGTSISSGGEYKMEIYHSNGKARAHCELKESTGASAGVKAGPNLADNQLHTIACVKTSTGLTLQVDSVPYGTFSTALTGIINTKKPFTVGAKQGTLKGTPSDFYNGVMRSATLSIAQ